MRNIRAGGRGEESGRGQCVSPAGGSPQTAKDRIRSARSAVEWRDGDRGEKSAVGATWLLENKGGPLNIFWIDADPAGCDHAAARARAKRAGVALPALFRTVAHLRFCMRSQSYSSLVA